MNTFFDEMNKEQFEAILKKNLPFYNILDENDKINLRENGRSLIIKRNSLLQRDENDGNVLFILIDGKARIFSSLNGSKEVTFHYINNDEIIILSDHLSGALLLDYYVEVIEDSLLLKFNLDSILEKSNKKEHFQRYFIQELFYRYQDLSLILVNTLSENLNVRIATLLVKESGQSSEPVIKMTHEEMANLLNSSREQVSRELGSFQKEKLIRLGYGNITIRDFDRLNKLAKIS